MMIKPSVKSSVVLGMILSVLGVVTIFAIPAMTEKGKGCSVRNGPAPGNYVVDEACTFHQVLKLDDEGNIEFFHYQDKGQVQSAWRPDRALRIESNLCYDIDQGEVCGRVTETITPSGEYKSSFKTN